MNPFFFRLLEAKAVEILLRSPTFHRTVQKVHKQIHEMRHGKPAERYGGTNLETPETSQQGTKKLVELFWDELKNGHKSDLPPKGKK